MREREKNKDGKDGPDAICARSSSETRSPPSFPASGLHTASTDLHNTHRPPANQPPRLANEYISQHPTKMPDCHSVIAPFPIAVALRGMRGDGMQAPSVASGHFRVSQSFYGFPCSKSRRTSTLKTCSSSPPRIIEEWNRRCSSSGGRRRPSCCYS